VTTISIKEDTRKHLLKIAADLQRQQGRRVDFDATIKHLIHFFEHQKKDIASWESFTTPEPGLDFDELYQLLIQERLKDNG